MDFSPTMSRIIYPSDLVQITDLQMRSKHDAQIASNASKGIVTNLRN